MLGHRLLRPVGELLGLLIGVLAGLGDVEPLGHVVQRIMGRGLIGDDVGRHSPAQQFGDDRCCIAHDAYREGPAVVLGLEHAVDRIVEIVGDLVEVAGLDAALQARAVDVDHEADALVHRDGQWLGAAHASAPGGDREGAGERAAEALGRDRGEGLVRALEDALGADVDP